MDLPMKSTFLLVVLGALVACATSSSSVDTSRRNPADPAGVEAPVDPPSQTLQIPAAPPEAGTPEDPHDHDGAGPGHDMHRHGQPSAQSGGVDTEGITYTCPMHPEVASKEPGRCPKCSMTLVPTKKGAP